MCVIVRSRRVFRCMVAYIGHSLFGAACQRAYRSATAQLFIVGEHDNASAKDSDSDEPPCCGLLRVLAGPGCALYMRLVASCERSWPASSKSA